MRAAELELGGVFWLMLTRPRQPALSAFSPSRGNCATVPPERRAPNPVVIPRRVQIVSGGNPGVRVPEEHARGMDSGALVDQAPGLLAEFVNRFLNVLERCFSVDFKRAEPIKKGLLMVAGGVGVPSRPRARLPFRLNHEFTACLRLPAAKHRHKFRINRHFAGRLFGLRSEMIRGLNRDGGTIKVHLPPKELINFVEPEAREKGEGENLELFPAARLTSAMVGARLFGEGRL